MNLELKKIQITKLKKYLKDEKENHPTIWKALTHASKAKQAVSKFIVTAKEKNLITKILSIKNPISLRRKCLTPKMSQFERAEKYGGQLRIALNPKKKKKKNNPSKLDRCVKAVKKSGTALNAYAVCKKSTGRKNPRFKKGSKAAKEFMAKLRKMRGK